MGVGSGVTWQNSAEFYALHCSSTVTCKDVLVVLHIANSIFPLVFLLQWKKPSSLAPQVRIISYISEQLWKIAFFTESLCFETFVILIIFHYKINLLPLSS